MSEFHDQIARYRAAIEAFLQAQFCQELPQKRLFDAMRYSLLAGGKRIRPVLTLELRKDGAPVNPLDLLRG